MTKRSITLLAGIGVVACQMVAGCDKQLASAEKALAERNQFNYEICLKQNEIFELQGEKDLVRDDCEIELSRDLS